MRQFKRQLLKAEAALRVYAKATDGELPPPPHSHPLPSSVTAHHLHSPIAAIAHICARPHVRDRITHASTSLFDLSQSCSR